MEVAKPSIVYRYGEGLYVNMTNRCPTACEFCIKRSWGMLYRGNDLDLKTAEPSAADVLEMAKAEWSKKNFSELVFCGYGEPAMRLDAVIEISKAVRSGEQTPLPATLRIRMNTNGLANAIWGRNTVPELKGLIDSVSVSLNATSRETWLKVMRPAAKYAADGYEKVLEFISECARALPETTATFVEGTCDKAEFSAIAAKLGAAAKARPRLEKEQEL